MSVEVIAMMSGVSIGVVVIDVESSGVLVRVELSDAGVLIGVEVIDGELTDVSGIIVVESSSVLV